MATYHNGIDGPFRGKVGAVIYSSWKGIPYVKARPKPRTKPPTEDEITNRNKFGIAHRWLQPVTDFVREGFKGYSSTVEGFLAAKSYLLKNAFEGEGDDMVINPALVKVSYGCLPLSDNITAQLITPKEIQFTWDTKIEEGANSFDQIMMLAYDIENRKAFIRQVGELRKAGTGILPLKMTECTWHLYAAFVAWDRSCQSDSVYLGTISN
jgi:hypothetical protein